MLKNIVFVLFCLLSFSSSAEIKPENVLAANCLETYQNAYHNSKGHKAFSYARESETDKHQCYSVHTAATIEQAKQFALDACSKHQLNAECFIIDIDGQFIVEEGQFSEFIQPDSTPLSDEEKKEMKAQAADILLGTCLSFFEKSLDDNEHRAFSYSLDPDGKFACGKSDGFSIKAASLSAIEGCNISRNRKGEKAPKSACKLFSQNKEILLTLSDYNIKQSPKTNTYLSSSEYDFYLNQAKEIINKGPCLFQMKYYLRGKQHKAYYLASDPSGKQVCGRAEGMFTPKLAKETALQNCQENVKKNNLSAKCSIFATNLEFVGKPEHFGIVSGEADYQQAIFKGNLPKIKKYISDGADVNAVSKDGTSPIFIAAGKGDKDFFDELVTKGANINQLTKDNSSLLFAATAGGNPNIVRNLLDNGLDINKQGFQNNTVLHMALQRLDTYIAGIYIREGADPSLKNSTENSAYDIANNLKVDLDSMKVIDVEIVEGDCSIVAEAANKGDIHGLEQLAALDADMSKVCESGMSSLYYAKSDVEVIRKLVELGADVNMRQRDQRTPLINTVTYGDYDIIKLKTLLELGADKTLKDASGKTAYDYVSEDGNNNAEVQELLKL